jgi:hypothetical protein
MQTLLVYPNPWSAFDKNGVPCGVCPRDPVVDAGGPGQFVGARIDPKNTKVLQDFAALHGGGARGAKLARHELRSPMQATFYEYLGIASQDPELAEQMASKDPVEIPSTKYYRDRLQEGSLIAADQATAKAARLNVFTEPAEFFKFRQLPEDHEAKVKLREERAKAEKAKATQAESRPSDAPVTSAPALPASDSAVHRTGKTATKTSQESDK